MSDGSWAVFSGFAEVILLDHNVFLLSIALISENISPVWAG